MTVSPTQKRAVEREKNCLCYRNGCKYNQKGAMGDLNYLRITKRWPVVSTRVEHGSPGSHSSHLGCLSHWVNLRGSISSGCSCGFWNSFWFWDGDWAGSFHCQQHNRFSKICVLLHIYITCFPWSSVVSLQASITFIFLYCPIFALDFNLFGKQTVAFYLFCKALICYWVNNNDIETAGPSTQLESYTV